MVQKGSKLIMEVHHLLAVLVLERSHEAMDALVPLSPLEGALATWLVGASL